MPEFQFRAIDENKQIIQGKRQAASAEELANRLLSESLIPLDIQAYSVQTRKQTFSLASFIPFLKPKVPTDDLQMFCRQMYTLLKSGFPIFIAITRLAETTKNAQLTDALIDILNMLNKGLSLSQCLSQYPEIFTLFFINLVRVGENTGRLDEIFLYLSDYINLESETRNKMKSALRYPMIVLVTMFIAMLIVNAFVIPSFADMFKGFKAQLPLPTQILMFTSNIVVNYWYLLLSAMLASFIWFRYVINTPVGAVRWSRLKTKIPYIGWIIQRTTLSRFSVLYAMVLRSGLSAVEGMKLVSASANDAYFSKHLSAAIQLIERGETISSAIEKTQLFPPLVVQMITLGEESGNIEGLLENVAEYYQRETAFDLEKLGHSIEPILMVFLGGMLLVLALAIFLPMWSMAGQIQG